MDSMTYSSRTLWGEGLLPDEGPIIHHDIAHRDACPGVAHAWGLHPMGTDLTLDDTSGSGTGRSGAVPHRT